MLRVSRALELRIGLRVKLRAGLRVKLRAELRAELRVKLRAELRAELQGGDPLGPPLRTACSIYRMGEALVECVVELLESLV